MSKQDRKYSLSLAGEFFVAAELQRRGVSAAVTYGNAKQADVVVLSASGNSAAVLEVKSTASPRKWVVGNSLPQLSERLWVFVHIPDDKGESPRYFILTSRELYEILKPRHDEANRKYLAKNGKEFDGIGVYSLPVEDAGPHHDRWDKVLDRVRKD